MRRKILLFIIRVIRFLGKEKQLIPELRGVERVVPDRFYKHYGRVLLSRANPDEVTLHYYRRPKGEEQWKEIRKAEYEHVLQQQNKGHLRDIEVRWEQTGDKCALCCCERLHIPCQCNFQGGERTGYFVLIDPGHQQSDITTL